jgi:hypothetical protein
VDLFEHAAQAGTSRDELTEALARALKRGAFDRKRLRDMSQQYGTKATNGLIESVLTSSGR